MPVLFNIEDGTFKPEELIILQYLQGDLPNVLEPFAFIAQKAGVSENFVLDFISRLRSEKIIRRFGATLAHVKSGYSANALVAWNIRPCTQEEMEKAGLIASGVAAISHCYYRPSKDENWPFELFTMFHAPEKSALSAAVEKLQKLFEVEGIYADYVVLETLKEFKKSSMKYF